MLDYRKIRLLSPEEQAERAAQRLAEEAQERQRILDELDEWTWEPERGGRRPIVLPPEIARRVLDDVAARLSHRAIECKYANTPYPFSRRWLARALNNGTLAQMAGMGHFMGQNLAQNGHALTPI